MKIKLFAKIYAEYYKMHLSNYYPKICLDKIEYTSNDTFTISFKAGRNGWLPVVKEYTTHQNQFLKRVRLDERKNIREWWGGLSFHEKLEMLK